VNCHRCQHSHKIRGVQSPASTLVTCHKHSCCGVRRSTQQAVLRGRLIPCLLLRERGIEILPKKRSWLFLL
jgi:hypothetical protein